MNGAKGVGKTATARRRCVNARFPDQPGVVALLGADPYLVALDEPPVLIDVWQPFVVRAGPGKRRARRDPWNGLRRDTSDVGAATHYWVRVHHRIDGAV